MADLRVGGFVPFSTSDWPGQLAAVVFCQGCPWRCVYCHNPHLQPPTGAEHFAWPQVLGVLERRRGRLDAVVFSGGEPTLQAGLSAGIDEVRAMGFMVGLHTAGMYPARLEPLLDRVDWVGLDLKAPFSDYPATTRVAGSGSPVRESLRLLLERGVAHELRCTWHPMLLEPSALRRLLEEIEALRGSTLVLQPYRTEGTLEPLPALASTAAAELLEQLEVPEGRLRLREG